MCRVKKRTKSTEQTIEYYNNWMKNNNVKSVLCAEVILFQDYLLKSDQYRGYVHCKYKDYTDVTGKTEKIIVPCIEADCDFVQLL